MNLSLGSYPTHSFTFELVFFYHLSALASNVVWLRGDRRLGWGVLGIISFSLGAYGVPGFIPIRPLQKFSSFNFFAYQMEGPKFN